MEEKKVLFEEIYDLVDWYENKDNCPLSEEEFNKQCGEAMYKLLKRILKKLDDEINKS